MVKHGSGYSFAQKTESHDSLPLDNPPPNVVDVVINSEALRINKQQQQTRQQQQKTIPCELSTEEWDCDYWIEELENGELTFGEMLTESELFDHIKSPEHVKGMILLLEKFGVEGSARFMLPTNYPHQVDNTIIHIKQGMSEANKKNIRNWGGFVKWYIEHTATDSRPTFRSQKVPFQPRTNWYR
jgi:hypothetical protein